MKTYVVAIGNSDNSLTQIQWAGLCSDIEKLVDAYSEQTFAKTYSLTNSEYQNAVFLFAGQDSVEDRLRLLLPAMAHMWRQDSIAIMVGDSELIKADSGAKPSAQ